VSGWWAGCSGTRGGGGAPPPRDAGRARRRAERPGFSRWRRGGRSIRGGRPCRASSRCGRPRRSRSPDVGAALGALAARLLGLVLVVAAFGKGLDPAGFAADIAALGILSARLAPLAAVASIAGEAGLGTALLAGLRRPAVLVATNPTFALFL